MTADRKSAHARTVAKEYADYGMLGGLAIGLVAGALYAGPHVHHWSVMKVAGSILGLGVACSILGYLAVSVALQSEGSSGIGDSSDPGHHSGHSSGDGGGTHGGGGDCGGGHGGGGCGGGY